MHFGRKKEKYAPVHNIKGGTRIERFLNNACARSCCSNGLSFHGRLHNMICHLGNYKGESLSTLHEGLFTLCDYIKSNMLTKIRLYLLTKVKSNFCQDYGNFNTEFHQIHWKIFKKIYILRIINLTRLIMLVFRFQTHLLDVQRTKWHLHMKFKCA